MSFIAQLIRVGEIPPWADSSRSQQFMQPAADAGDAPLALATLNFFVVGLRRDGGKENKEALKRLIDSPSLGRDEKQKTKKTKKFARRSSILVLVLSSYTALYSLSHSQFKLLIIFTLLPLVSPMVTPTIGTNLNPKQTLNDQFAIFEICGLLNPRPIK